MKMVNVQVLLLIRCDVERSANCGINPIFYTGALDCINTDLIRNDCMVITIGMN